MERFFILRERGTTEKNEFIAGMTTFFSMVFILMVNANMFADPSYANALVLILLAGMVFILLTVTGLRKMIFDSLPDAVRVAIPAGVGLFITLLGLQNAGIVVPYTSTAVDLASFNLMQQSWGDIMPMVVTVCTFPAIVVMSYRNLRGSVFIGIVGGMALYFLLGLTIPGFYDSLNITFISPAAAFGEFTSQSFFMIFREGFDFYAYQAAHGNANLILTIATTALAFCMVDVFDTLGTLYAACERANLMDEKGEPINMNRAMLSDAIATSIGAMCGTSTVTTFSEVNAGVAAGGRTGLSFLFCGDLKKIKAGSWMITLMFILMLFLTH